MERLYCKLSVVRILNTVLDSSLCLRKKLKKKSTAHLYNVVHDTNNRKDVYSPTTSAVGELCSHTGCYNRYLQTAYHSMSTVSCSRGNTYTSREFCHIFHLHFPTVCGHKTESQTVGWTFTDRTDWLLVDLLPTHSSSRTPSVFEK
jgi:hypothetical protein